MAYQNILLIYMQIIINYIIAVNITEFPTAAFMVI